MALSDHAGEMSLKIPMCTPNTGLATLGDRPMRFNSYTTEKVRVSTLDAEMERLSIPRVDFIKIDVEGHELFTLRGAENTLKRLRPLIIAEFNAENTAQNGYDRGLILDYMAGLGYSYRPVSDEDVLLYPPEHRAIAEAACGHLCGSNN
jgi:hypothetical protein